MKFRDFDAQRFIGSTFAKQRQRLVEWRVELVNLNPG